MPQSGQTVHGNSLRVRYQPVADRVVFGLYDNSGTLLIDPSELAHVDTGEFTFNPDELLALPKETINLTISQTYERMLSGTIFRSVKEYGSVHSQNIVLNFVP
ncbi:MAG: hypothetical protein H0X31_17230 [Nostocaceae cyanobacterium]|nr:hypothetical protein [Nostocaceae cyanobacterium]